MPHSDTYCSLLQYNLIPLCGALYHTMMSSLDDGFYAKNIFCYLPSYDKGHKHELIGLLNKQCHDPINHCFPFFNSWVLRIFSGYFCAWIIKACGAVGNEWSTAENMEFMFNLSNIAKWKETKHWGFQDWSFLTR